MTKIPPRLANDAWVVLYAGTAMSAADARTALDALPSYSPLPAFGHDVFKNRAMGNTLFLAGRLDEALPYLRRAVTACYSNDFVFSHHRAAETLGEALEATGDAASACAAYANVLLTWGNAKPRSKTADAARAHSKKLGCPK
jgi:hypothetical protein